MNSDPKSAHPLNYHTPGALPRQNHLHALAKFFVSGIFGLLMTLLVARLFHLIGQQMNAPNPRAGPLYLSAATLGLIGIALGAFAASRRAAILGGLLAGIGLAMILVALLLFASIGLD